MRPKVIAVDFDGCLCENRWPDIGEPNQFVIDELRRQQANGAKLILWTCRNGADLEKAISWCALHDLHFDAINDNLEENKKYFGGNSRKVWADEYWDDKSVLIVDINGGTSILQRNAAGSGGLTGKRWERTSIKVSDAPPCEAGEVELHAVPSRSFWGRLKGWWKKWRSE